MSHEVAPLPPQFSPTGKPTPLTVARAARLLIDHNPFFLLSGVCMLAGCYIINGAIHEQPDRLGVLLGLLGVFNLYEVLVIALGFYLLRWRGLVRDAGWLLLLEVLLLVDATLLYNEVSTASLWVGALVATAATIWSLVKIALLFKLVNLRLKPEAWALIAVNLVCLLGLPVLLRGLANIEALSAAWMFQLWVLGGGLVALQALPSGWWACDVGYRGRLGLRHAVGIAAAALPIISVIGHLRAAMYVYDLPVHWSHYAPLLLGGAVVLMRDATRWRHAELRNTVLVIIAIALLCTLDQTARLTLLLGEQDPLMISPLRVTLLAGAAVLVLLCLQQGAWWLTLWSGGMTLAAVLGHDGASIRAALRQIAESIAKWHQALRPQSTFSWGVLTVTLAFVFLGIGALLSLMKRHNADDVRAEHVRTDY